jgi:hypothetical protein
MSLSSSRAVARIVTTVPGAEGISSMGHLL